MYITCLTLSVYQCHVIISSLLLLFFNVNLHLTDSVPCTSEVEICLLVFLRFLCVSSMLAVVGLPVHFSPYCWWSVFACKWQGSFCTDPSTLGGKWLLVSVQIILSTSSLTPLIEGRVGRRVSLKGRTSKNNRWRIGLAWRRFLSILM